MALPVLLAAGSTGLQLFGRMRQTDMDNKLARINAQQLREEAQAITAQAHQDVDYDRGVQAANRGAIIASFAARGIDVDSTTPMDGLLTQLRVDELNNARKIYSAELQARNLQFQAKMAKFQAKASKEQAFIGAFGDLAGGAGRALYYSR